MTQDFITEKGLVFIKDSDIGDFWGGDDSIGEQSYELFFSAGETGPTPIQIDRYHSLCEAFGSVYNTLKEKYHSYLASPEARQGEKWMNVPVSVIFINVNKESADSDIELTCLASRGFFVFTKRLSFVANLRDNRLTSFEVL